MPNVRNLLGLPVVATESGALLGRVEDAMLDVGGASLAALTVRGRDAARPQRLRFQDIFIVGPDAVTVRNAGALSDDEPESGVRQSFKAMLDKTVFTEAGECLGTLADISFTAETGELKTYELSDGLIADLIYGRFRMPLPEAQSLGEDRLIVPESMSGLKTPKTAGGLAGGAS